MSSLDAITIPDSEHEQVEGLHKLLQLCQPELVGPNGTERTPLPPSVYIALKRVVEMMKRGQPISLVPQDQEITTQAAANFLGASRPHVIKLLEEGRIPYHRVGSHRRIRFIDIQAYAKKRDAERTLVLNRIAKQAFDDGLYQKATIPEGGEDE